MNYLISLFLITDTVFRSLIFEGMLSALSKRFFCDFVKQLQHFFLFVVRSCINRFFRRLPESNELFSLKTFVRIFIFYLPTDFYLDLMLKCWNVGNNNVHEFCQTKKCVRIKKLFRKLGDRRLIVTEKKSFVGQWNEAVEQKITLIYVSSKRFFSK